MDMVAPLVLKILSVCLTLLPEVSLLLIIQYVCCFLSACLCLQMWFNLLENILTSTAKFKYLLAQDCN